MDNFEELRKKVEAYPNSSLFVPLSEEYKKRGELDEAINVLKRGLERQPSYISARVALAKIYLEKGLRAEAVEELVKVVSVSPDNFLAHKKLAETYCQLGKRAEAISQYNELIKLNPGDEAAAEALERLEGGGPCDEGEVTADMAAEIEALSMPPEEGAAQAIPGAESAKGFEQALETVDEEFDTEAFAGQTDESPEDSGVWEVEEEAWDVEDSDFDMGGLEFEPDGVYGDEDSGEITERESEAGLDIGADFASGSDEESMQEEASIVDEPDLSDTDGDLLPGEIDILTAAEKVGHEILNDAPSGEPRMGRESLVPSGGFEGDTSKEYSGESFIGNDDENVVVTPAPGLETFEPGEGGEVQVPAEDKTVMMREPLAGMDESFAQAQDEGEAAPLYEEEGTVVMEALTFESEPAAEVEAVAEVFQAPEDRTVVMQASELEAIEPIAVEADDSDDGVIYESEPFARFVDAGPASEEEEPPITAEAGTIGEEPLDGNEYLINDPFSPPPSIPSAEVADVLEAEVYVEEEAAPAVDHDSEMKRADGLIAAGDYSEARRIYSSLLSASPGDKIISMKIQELMMLLKVTGQGGELYNNRLEAFHSAIMRRRDEFRKST